MKAIYKDQSELPLVMCAEDVAKVMGISKANAYAVMHCKGFPTITLGKRMMVQREQFFRWLDTQQRIDANSC